MRGPVEADCLTPISVRPERVEFICRVPLGGSGRGGRVYRRRAAKRRWKDREPRPSRDGPPGVRPRAPWCAHRYVAYVGWTQKATDFLRIKPPSPYQP